MPQSAIVGWRRRHRAPTQHDPTVASVKRIQSNYYRKNLMDVIATWKSVSKVPKRTASSTVNCRSMHARERMSDLTASTPNMRPLRAQKSYEWRCLIRISLASDEIVGPVMELDGCIDVPYLWLNQFTIGSHFSCCSAVNSLLPSCKWKCKKRG